ncbi:hypothetical protein C477_07398 [Haloterrigena salina JCM 13891]|uniref:Uncharacterized protein n=1 Tax=Haloterrigena salina JCM 13891 TaxID=1227488 RepID=M0C975_9EURY|nr:hypothetical protein [Haloterrigena salina]ELZ19785.1 hypothetical protein C477_07398 [Haloterrigena salina JCM 13891]
MRDKSEHERAVSNHEIDRPAGGSSESPAVSRRSLMLGATGAAGIAGLSLPAAAAGWWEEEIDIDEHTRQTYRSIVDAIIPETPKRDGVQEPGALAIDLEEYLIWNVEHGTGQSHQRDRAPGRKRGRGRGNGRGRGRGKGRGRGHGEKDDRNDGRADREALRVDLPADENGLEQLVAGLESELGFSTESDLGMSRSDVFGSLAGLELRVVGNGDSVLTVETASRDGSIEEMTNKQSELPLATLHATVLDLYALVFVLGGGNRKNIRPRRKFAGGGFFTFLAPIDRVQCLLFVIDSYDSLETVADVILPEAILAKKLSGSMLSLTAYGYYSEWSGYEDGTEPMADRDLETPAGAVQGHRQTGYPGPADGHAGLHEAPIESFDDNDWK